jgi:hypothetical protein
MPALAAFGILESFQEQARSAESSDKLTFDDFVKRVGSMAQQLIADANRNEDDYLFKVASLAARTEGVPSATLGEPFKGVIRSGLNYRGSGIVVVQWSMEAGLKYPAHNHPNYNGVTVGLEGECRIANFDIVGKAPDLGTPGNFEVQESQSQLMIPGRVVSIMSTAHHNIHRLQTTSHRVRGIDVMTLVGKHIGFAFVEIDDASRNSEGIHEAHWGEYFER